MTRPEVLLQFSVPGDPVAKGRPRVSTRGGRARAYTPKRTRDYEASVQQAAALAVINGIGEWPIDGPVFLEVIAVFRRPHRLFGPKDDPGRVLHDRRPDLDNVVKAVLDGIEGADVWRDDAQVAQVGASKWYGRIAGHRREKRSEAPHVLVRVCRAERICSE